MANCWNCGTYLGEGSDKGIYCSRCLWEKFEGDPGAFFRAFGILIIIAGGIAVYIYFGVVVLVALISVISAIVYSWRCARFERSGAASRGHPALADDADIKQEDLAEIMESTVQRENYYARVLGLTPPIIPGNIRRAFREKSSQYHPDKVQHMGPEIRDLAETKSREINAAYEFFRQRYGF